MKIHWEQWTISLYSTQTIHVSYLQTAFTHTHAKMHTSVSSYSIFQKSLFPFSTMLVITVYNVYGLLDKNSSEDEKRNNQKDGNSLNKLIIAEKDYLEENVKKFYLR